jgi:hypothetical protein
MVYEEIETATNRYERTHTPSEYETGSEYIVTLYRKSLSTSILGTCRLVNQKATPILSRKLTKLANEPLRFSLEWNAVLALFRPLSAPHVYRSTARLTTIQLLDRLEKSACFFLSNLLCNCSTTADIQVTAISRMLVSSDQQTPGARYEREATARIIALAKLSSWEGLSMETVYNRFPGTTDMEAAGDRLYGRLRQMELKPREDSIGVDPKPSTMLYLDYTEWSLHLLELEMETL